MAALAALPLQVRANLKSQPLKSVLKSRKSIVRNTNVLNWTVNTYYIIYPDILKRKQYLLHAFSLFFMHATVLPADFEYRFVYIKTIKTGKGKHPVEKIFFSRKFNSPIDPYLTAFIAFCFF